MTYCRTESVRSLILAGLENSEDWQLENGKTKQNIHGYQAALRGMAAALQMIERDEASPSAAPASGGDGALEAERAELIAANEAATGWGAAVGARSERIVEIERAIAAQSPASPEPVADDDADLTAAYMVGFERGKNAAKALATPMSSQEDRLREALKKIEAWPWNHDAIASVQRIAQVALSADAKAGSK